MRRLAAAFRRKLATALRQAWQLTRTEQQLRRQIFRDIYKNKLWGGEAQSKYFSGWGSRGDAAKIYIERIPEILRHHAVELGRPARVIDLGCGDFTVGRALVAALPDMVYVGCDIVPELIAHNIKSYADERVSFRQLDIVSDPLPAGDVCLVRQVLQHLSNAEIMRFLQRVSYKYIYVTEGQPDEATGPFNPDKTTDSDVRFDWRTPGGRGVELNAPPYCLTTQEIFRVSVPPYGMIITWRVFPDFAVKNCTNRRRDDLHGRPEP